MVGYNMMSGICDYVDVGFGFLVRGEGGDRLMCVVVGFGLFC